jgi:hypothetical protein
VGHHRPGDRPTRRDDGVLGLHDAGRGASDNGGLQSDQSIRRRRRASRWRSLLFTGTKDVDEALDVGGQTQEERDALADIAGLQVVLRAAVRRGLEDDDFRQVFVDDDAIRERWPVDP